jgi:aldehyde:ferredoxin oxidoreductase
MVLDRKIAFVNLSDASYEIKSIPLDWRRKFLGGRGINMHLLSKPYSSTLDPFSPDNPLIFGAGLLAGILGFGSRMNITSRSPESGHLGDSNMGGEFGAEMVKAGLSHIVVTGKSRKAVYLFISEDKIEFCDARKLKGLYTVETQKRIRFERRDRRVQIARSGCHLCERLSDFLRSRQGVIDVA